MTLLEKLAPYLPYEIEMCFIIRDEIIRKGILNNISINSSETHPIRLSIDSLNELEHEWMFKPILRPLSDLDRSDYRLFNSLFGLIKSEVMELTLDNMPYGIYKFYLENHYDVFGMIESGEAIDINTLK